MGRADHLVMLLGLYFKALIDIALVTSIQRVKPDKFNVTFKPECELIDSRSVKEES